MKKIWLLIIPVLTILFACNSKPGSGDAITLKFNLPTGSSYNYNIDMNMLMKGDANGQPINMNNKMAMGYNFYATGDSAGWKKLTATINRIAMNIDAGAMKINFDSDKPTDSSDVASGIMGKVLGALKGGHFGFTMNDKGQVGEVTGIEEMVQRMMSSLNVPNAELMSANVNSAFNKENFKQNIQQSFGMYPDKPVKPGDTWTSSMSMNNQGMQMKMDNTYTLESVSNNNAHVKINSKITSPEADAAMNLNGTMTGTMDFDIATGVPLNGNIEMNMNMTPNSSTQSTPMNMDMKMKITGKKS